VVVETGRGPGPWHPGQTWAWYGLSGSQWGQRDGALWFQCGHHPAWHRVANSCVSAIHPSTVCPTTDGPYTLQRMCVCVCVCV